MPQTREVKFEPVERQSATYCLPMDVDDFIALCKAEGDLNHKGETIPYEDHLIYRLEGDSTRRDADVEGVCRVEYNGHFGAAIHFTLDDEYDTPETHRKIREIISDQVITARNLLATPSADMEA